MGPAIAGGALAALAWGVSSLTSSRSSKEIGAASVLAWVMIAGFACAVPAAALAGAPAELDRSDVFLLAGSGVGTVSGLLASYHALRLGRVAIVQPIVACEGAAAALLGLLHGDSLSRLQVATLAVIVVGIVAVSRTSQASGGPDAASDRDRRAVLFAIASALLLGGSLFCTGVVGAHVGTPWILLAGRGIGVAAIALPLLARRQLRITRASAPLVIATGILEVVALTAYAWGARTNIAVTAVVGSQFAVVAAIGGVALFGEHLTRTQAIGILLTMTAVSALAAGAG
jgi:drug/metabolite transporter (DMT)-like permease